MEAATLLFLVYLANDFNNLSYLGFFLLLATLGVHCSLLFLVLYVNFFLYFIVGDYGFFGVTMIFLLGGGLSYVCMELNDTIRFNGFVRLYLFCLLGFSSFNDGVFGGTIGFYSTFVVT